MICWLNDYDYAASCRIGSISAIILLCGHVGLITAASWKKMCFVLNVWDSNSYVRDTKSYLKYSVRLSCSYIYDIVTYDSVFRMYDLVSLTYDSVFRMHDLVSLTYDSVFRMYDLVSLTNDLVSLRYNWQQFDSVIVCFIMLKMKSLQRDY